MASTGSTVFALSAFFGICICVLLLLRHFIRLRTAPAYLLVPVFLAIALPASIALLVPIDLASRAEARRGIWLPERALLVCWRISYWLTFILPILGDFMDAGYRDPKGRLTYTLRTNAKYYLLVLGCAVGGLVYIIISYGFDLTAIKSLVMALAYVWGLVFAIYLMGHGLVAIPRRLIRSANISGSLRALQAKAPKVHDKMEESISVLEELQAQVTQLSKRKTGTARDFQEWIDDLAAGNELPESRIASDPIAREATARVPAIVTERYLADVTRRSIRAHHQRARYIQEWDLLVREASQLQNILDSEGSKRLTFGSHSSRFDPLTPYTRHVFYTRILPTASIVLGGFLALGSTCILLSEFIKWPAPQLSPVSLTVVHHPSNMHIGFGGQLTAAIWIFYMCLCTLSSLSDVPVWGGRALVARNTHSESVCWYALQVSKLTVPLSYNFLTFLPKQIHENTVFFQFLGRLINLTPLGAGFDFIFPIFILLPVCATLFNLYGRIKSVFGFNFFEEEEEESNGSGFRVGGWREGRDLINRELQGGPGSLGLSPRPSSDDAARAAPTLWVPPAERNENSSEQSSRPQAMRPTRPSARGPALEPTLPEDDENIFQLFGKRVKNTIDTIDKPKWMQPSSPTSSGRPFNFKKPKWMTGGDTPEPSSNGGDGNSTLDRLFGGRSNDGQVRL
ncbi:MAG: hypothetical protein Q9160_007222 [Pyrenula sp. 1 TL-2023]